MRRSLTIVKTVGNIPKTTKLSVRMTHETSSQNTILAQNEPTQNLQITSSDEISDIYYIYCFDV